MRWPISEVLAWQTLFEMVGPLDWTREDYRDARRVCVECGKKGDTIDDFRLYKPVETKKTDAEEAEETIRQMMPLAMSCGGEEAVANLKKELNRIRIEAYRGNRND